MRADDSDESFTLWQQARDTAWSAGPETLDRAAGCLAVALNDMTVSTQTNPHAAAAAALAGGQGVCTVAGAPDRAHIAGAATANAYLMHARLTDDSFRVAAHPGLAVVPVAMASAEHALHNNAKSINGEHLLRAVIGGYECACRLAEQLLPEVSERGWRVTSVIAPLAAAATVALALDMSDDAACAALGLASATTGGPLGVVSTDGDAWRLQPALAVQAGVSAALAAAAGLRAAPDSLTGEHGLYSLFGGSSIRRVGQSPGPAAVHRVTFKRYPVAMYGQSIFDAVRAQQQMRGEVRRITVTVAPFAAAYGNPRRASTTSISSLEGITITALRTFHPDLIVEADSGDARIEILGDPTLPELTANVLIDTTDGRQFHLTGDGDTSYWTAAEFRRHCTILLGDRGGLIYDAASELPERDGLRRLLELWQATP